MQQQSKDEVMQGNAVIAKFMGHTLNDKGYWVHPKGYWKNHKTEHFLFHSSWGSLMPVVEKIEMCFDESIQVIIKDTRCSIEMSTQYGLTDEGQDINVPNCYSGFKKTKIEAVYDSIILFITWYNSLTLTPTNNS